MDIAVRATDMYELKSPRINFGLVISAQENKLK